MNVIQTFEFEASGERTEQPPFVSSNLFHITVNKTKMNADLKSSLVSQMQKWLDDNADDLGANLSIWQDTRPTGKNAHLMATAAETVLDAMALQSELEEKLG